MPVPLRRVVWAIAAARRGSPGGRFVHRVWPSYVDFNFHMNQASYLEVMELARWHWSAERRVLIPWLGRGLRPIVVEQEVTYRRDLKPLQRFEVESRLLRREGRTGTFVQRFLVEGQCHAEGRCRFLMVRRGKVLGVRATAALLDPFVEGEAGPGPTG